jgi:hypothetical protein
MKLVQVAAIAADAQSALHCLNHAERTGGTTPMLRAEREVQRARLAVCGEFFAEAVAVNDAEFQATPETA